MFITKPEYSRWLPPLETYENALGWGVIELGAALPMFLLDVQVNGSPRLMQGASVRLFASMLDLTAALAKLGTIEPASRYRCRVTGLYPPVCQRNSTSAWSVFQLSEIWEVTVEIERRRYECWLVINQHGEEIIEPCGVEGTSLRKIRRIYHAKTAR